MDQCTALHVASLIGATDIVRLLLVKGADIEARDNNLQTPLHYAMKVCETEWMGNIGTVKYLIKHNAKMDAVDISGQRPQDLGEKNPKLDLYEAGVLDIEEERRKRREQKRKLLYFCLFCFLLFASFAASKKRRDRATAMKKRSAARTQSAKAERRSKKRNGWQDRA